MRYLETNILTYQNDEAAFWGDEWGTWNSADRQRAFQIRLRAAFRHFSGYPLGREQSLFFIQKILLVKICSAQTIVYLIVYKCQCAPHQQNYLLLTAKGILWFEECFSAALNPVFRSIFSRFPVAFLLLSPGVSASPHRGYFLEQLSRSMEWRICLVVTTKNLESWVLCGNDRTDAIAENRVDDLVCLVRNIISI